MRVYVLFLGISQTLCPKDVDHPVCFQIKKKGNETMCDRKPFENVAEWLPNRWLKSKMVRVTGRQSFDARGPKSEAWGIRVSHLNFTFVVFTHTWHGGTNIARDCPHGPKCWSHVPPTPYCTFFGHQTAIPSPHSRGSRFREKSHADIWRLVQMGKMRWKNTKN